MWMFTAAAFSALLATAPVTTDAPLTDLVSHVQATYDKTTDFTAHYTQRYTLTALHRTQESQGTVSFKKPGMMRWEYTAPSKKSFVVDGKSLWIVDDVHNTAMVDACFKNDGLTASVAFLWGGGKIVDHFDVTWFSGVFGDKTDQHLLLMPKDKNAVFAKLILVIDPKSFRVKQSIVVDGAGNVNQFLYDHAEFNVALTDKAFNYTPAATVVTTRVPGSCNAPAAGLK